ncbi:acyltransferase ChoActase/COT/CPT [Xylariomycetidae sp. FL0641]|nr:acyltransferase ChoActase/COT/CPT [Xylariomycetidae sp. FL0641]
MMAVPTALPRQPLPSLEELTEAFLHDVAHLGTDEELENTQQAVDELLSPDGIGRTLFRRLESKANDPKVELWATDLYDRWLWLAGRDWHTRARNFFCTLPLSKNPHSQAEQASLITLSAYRYKLAIDRGTLPQDYMNGLPLCMETVHWIFNTNRAPRIGYDHVDRWPGNDHIVAMRNGHAYKIPLERQDGQIITHGELKRVFQAILDLPTTGVSWVNILTTGNRDDWAKARGQVLDSSPENAEAVTAIETALFTVCLEEGEPTTTTARAAAFLQDDGRNRWLDKALSFIVLANGVAAIFCEHSSVDGGSIPGLVAAIAEATVEHVEESSDDDVGGGSAAASAAEALTPLPWAVPAPLAAYADALRAAHLEAVAGYALRTWACAGLGAAELRARSLPPKSVFQVALQLAIRRYLGGGGDRRSPFCVETLGQRHFRGGRIDSLNAATAEAAAFCRAALDPFAAPARRRELLVAAVRAHARLWAQVSWGKGWMRNLDFLQQMARPGGEEEEEEAPRLFADPLYLRTQEREVYTTFQDAYGPEAGNFRVEREGIYICGTVLEHRAEFVVTNGNGKAQEFIRHLKAAINIVKRLL